MTEDLCLCPEGCDKIITVLISSTRTEHPVYLKENAASALPAKFPLEVETTGSDAGSLKPEKVTTELLRSTRLLLPLQKELGTSALLLSH